MKMHAVNDLDLPCRCNHCVAVTCIISALPFATPQATVPIPASATSLTDTLALGFIYLFMFRVIINVKDISFS